MKRRETFWHWLMAQRGRGWDHGPWSPGDDVGVFALDAAEAGRFGGCCEHAFTSLASVLPHIRSNHDACPEAVSAAREAWREYGASSR